MNLPAQNARADQILRCLPPSTGTWATIAICSLTRLRDRALIGVMIYSFARSGAVLQMNVGDDSQCMAQPNAYHMTSGRAKEAGINQSRQQLAARHRHHRLPEKQRQLGTWAGYGESPLAANDELALNEYERGN